MEIELLPILLDMEATGIKFYKDKAEERLFELHSQLVRINIRLKATYGKILCIQKKSVQIRNKLYYIF